MKETNKELGIKIISNKHDINILEPYINDSIKEYHIFGECIKHFSTTEYILNMLSNIKTIIHIDNVSNISQKTIDIINSTKTIVSLNFNSIQHESFNNFFLLPKFHRLHIDICSTSLKNTFDILNKTFINTYFKINGYLPAISINLNKLTNPINDVNFIINSINLTNNDDICFINYFFYNILNTINNTELTDTVVPYEYYYITNENNNINDYNQFIKLKNKLNHKCNKCQANLLCQKNDITNCKNKKNFYTEFGYKLVNNEIQRG